MNNIHEGRKSLEKALEHDRKGNVTEAIELYRKGISIVETECKNFTSGNENLYNDLLSSNNIPSMKERLDKLEKSIESAETTTFVEERSILHGTKGLSYQSIFEKKYLDRSVTSVSICDPYLVNAYQMDNLTRFCELLLTASSIKTIHVVTTTKESSSGFSNRSALATLQSGMEDHGVKLTFDIKDGRILHDRAIEFSNGYVVKIDRGLDIFLSSNRFTPGSFDLTLRTCRSCDITVYKKSRTVVSPSESRCDSPMASVSMPHMRSAIPLAVVPPSDMRSSSETGSTSGTKEKCKYKIVRCKMFPNCRHGDKCTFIHPNEPCWQPEKCPYGARKCKYLHVCNGLVRCSPDTCVYNGFEHATNTPLQGILPQMGILTVKK